jgi:predicted PurR-regulated permease PerM
MISQDKSNDLTFSIFRLVGYGLLLLAVVDIVNILIPPRFTDLAWILQATGTIIDRVPLPLLGFTFVFFGQGNLRKRWERIVLTGLSWTSLVTGIVFLVLIPVMLSIAMQMSTQLDTQTIAQTERQLGQIQQLQEQVNKTSPQDLASLFERLKQQGTLPSGIQDSRSFRTRLINEFSQAEKTIQVQSDATRTGQRNALMKDSIKWSIGALISSVLLLNIWRYTVWTRFKRQLGIRSVNAS